jgi:hypothetical protein
MHVDAALVDELDEIALLRVGKFVGGRTTDGRR